MIPLSTTTIKVLRPAASATADPTDVAADPTEIASGVRAVISSPSGSAREVNGEQEEVGFRLACDPTDLQHTDLVRDEATGDTYTVTWSRDRAGFGLDHVQAGLRQVRGEAA